MAVGKISGLMLQNNLERQGVDLSIETDVLYVDVTNGRVGFKNTSPQYTLDVTGNARLSGTTITNSTFTSNTGKLYFGSNANVVITGGSAGTVLSTDGSGNLTWASTASLNISGNTIVLGANTTGSLTSNAVTLTTSTYVTDGIALLNQVLGKLVPPSPPTFPNSTTLSISTLSSYRMCNFTQTDNTATGSKTVAGGTTVSTVRRSASYTTNTIANVGPGDSGTVTAYLNGTGAGNVALTSANSNGTYGNLVITNSVDYSVVTGNASGFWRSFSTYATGSVPAGWNEVYINHSGAGASTNVPSWYYDSSAPGTPTFSNANITLTSNSSTYSSTIPHFNSSTTFTLTANVSKLSGDMYPTSDTFVTGTAGGAFGAPTSITYATAGVTTPLARNLYVSSGSQYITTTTSIISGFGSSSSGPSLSCLNSYATGSNTFSPGVTILYKTGTGNNIEETSIPVTSVGTGSGNALRVVNPGSADTPAISANTAFNSTSSTLQTYDATVVAAVLKHDQTNYATGYLPVGPNLSTGRSGSQYFTFKFTRTVVSKFNVSFTGNVAGMWVALPGSTIDSTSTLNGWLDMSTAYSGSGVPGANTGAGGNGSNGCALGGTVTLNSSGSQSKTCTFGTVSSSSTVSNEIFVRIKLTSGQTVTALSILAATN